jgi:hypothetical protein
MPMMVATKKQQYAGKKIDVGDKFHVSIHDVRLLKALDRVADMVAVKAMTTETAPELVPAPIRHVVQEPKPEPKIVEETQPDVEEVQPVAEEVKIDSTNILDVINEVVEEGKKEEGSMPPSSSLSSISEYSVMLRDRARSLGLRVDGRWSDERVQREIDEYNKRTYQRMDVRASE